ncbi:MAG: polyprenyl synthetase family protein [Nocardioides sp.]
MSQPESDPTPWDLERFREQIAMIIQRFLDSQAARLAPLGEDAGRLLDRARPSLAGGKRFRAAFCYWGHRTISRTAPSGLLDACAALEILHASALAHDDLMDASEFRRGAPSVHRHFATQHAEAGWRGSSTAYGAAGAILLGDLMLTWADELLRTCGLEENRVSQAMALFDRCRSEVIVGQFLDVSAQARGQADVDTAMRVLRYKSAKYSIERPLHIGAALAGADTDHLAALTGFGLPLGEAFQLRDDLLGVFGDPDATGKPAGDDLIEGKRTVLLALALDASPDAAELEALVGSGLAPAQVERARELIVASGADRQVEAAIEALTQTARDALAKAEVDEDARSALLELAESATVRTR